MNRMDELIKEINYLANKDKTVGLNSEEKNKREKLRKEYLELFKEGFKKNYLENMYTVDEYGNKVKIKKVK